MKHLLHIFITVVCIAVVAGCADNSRLRDDIDRAGRLADTRPDSAIALLDSLSPAINQADKATRMRYDLMLIKSRDKAYIEHRNDSMIAPVVEYFTDHTDPDLTPLALYYAGRVYSDLGDAPRALDYYQKAVNSLISNDNDRLRTYIYTQIGDLYYRQGLFEYALNANKKSLDLSYALNDTLFIIDGLKEIAHTYINMNHEDSALICYKKAYELSQSINEEELSGCLLSQYAYLENSLGNKEVADSLIEKALMYDYKTENLKSVLYAITSKIYMQRGKSQQALPYLLWLCDNGSIYAKRNAYRNITLYHIQKMQWHDALKYNNKAFDAVDSIRKIEGAEAVARVKANYDYSLYKIENSDLKVNNARKNKIIIILSAISILIMLFIFFWWKSIKLKSQHQIELLNNMKFLHESETENILNEKLKVTEELHAKITNLLLENHSYNEKVNSLTDYITELENTLNQTTAQLEDLTSSKQISDNKLMSSEIVGKIKRNISDNNFNLSYNEWKALEKSIISNCPDFYKKLHPDRFMRALEWRVTMLIKIGISPSNISKMVNRSKETVTSIRSRLYAKVFKIEKASARDWDSFTRSL